ncbi:catabolite control protein A, partial [Frankia sp. Mgl5]|nr:catabolite control protein A [Frankia sp. Mgl5]
MGSDIKEDHIQALSTASVPIVLAATRDADSILPSVTIDYFQAAYDAARVLIDHGHKRIAMITSPLNDPLAGLLRFEGYKQALADAGMNLDEQLVAPGNYFYESGLRI